VKNQVRREVLRSKHHPQQQNLNQNCTKMLGATVQPAIYVQEEYMRTIFISVQRLETKRNRECTCDGDARYQLPVGKGQLIHSVRVVRGGKLSCLHKGLPPQVRALYFFCFNHHTMH
jgi:hypothetical protein